MSNMYCGGHGHKLPCKQCAINSERARVRCDPSQWPTDRAEIVRDAVLYDSGVWPEQLTSGVMFHMGERIARQEFEAVAGAA